MNRSDLQSLADSRVEDAKALLNAGRYPAAYYMVGYAIECALKSCIAKQIKEHDFPDRQLIADSYTHKLEQLLRISGVKAQLEKRAASENSFEVNWTTVKDWSPESRYDTTISDIKARDLFAAVTDPTHGVLAWLKTVW